jgi:hypothetical protein
MIVRSSSSPIRPMVRVYWLLRGIKFQIGISLARISRIQDAAIRLPLNPRLISAGVILAV